MNLGKDKTVAEIISRLEAAVPVGGPVEVEGTWGSFARLLAAYISKELGRPILYICPHIDDADKAGDDLRTFGGEGIETLPAWEGEEDLADATDEIRAERLRVTLKLVSGATKFIIPAPIQALCQPIPKLEALEESSLGLQVEKTVSPEEVVGWLVDNGFERVERVDLPGQFARRGGIIDIYAPLAVKIQDTRLKTQEPRLKTQDQAFDDRRRTTDDGRWRQLSPLSAGASKGAEAVRLEFFGDTIDNIRFFDPATQRSVEEVSSVAIGPATELLTPRLMDKQLLERALRSLDLSACTDEVRQQFQRDIDIILEGQQPHEMHYYASFFNEGSLFDYLPPQALLVLDETLNIERAVAELDAEAGQVSHW